jgi:hypothetical protein
VVSRCLRAISNVFFSFEYSSICLSLVFCSVVDDGAQHNMPWIPAFELMTVATKEVMNHKVKVNQM